MQVTREMGGVTGKLRPLSCHWPLDVCVGQQVMVERKTHAHFDLVDFTQEGEQPCRAANSELLPPAGSQNNHGLHNSAP